MHQHRLTCEYTARQMNFEVIRPNRFGFSVVGLHTALQHYSSACMRTSCLACMHATMHSTNQCLTHFIHIHIHFILSLVTFPPVPVPTFVFCSMLRTISHKFNDFPWALSISCSCFAYHEHHHFTITNTVCVRSAHTSVRIGMALGECLTN